MDFSFLPAVNASLNGTATVLLVIGRSLAKRGRVEAHRLVMGTAFGVSSLFLALYVTHKIWRNFENTLYHGVGAAKAFYLSVLLSHLTLAMAVPVLAILLVRYGLTGRVEMHRKLARVAWPIWMYVSITGVVIYLMLYRFNPQPA